MPERRTRRNAAPATSGGSSTQRFPLIFRRRHRQLRADDAAAADNFDVHIERNQSPSTIVDLPCGGCADIEAIATGGNAPYTFVWEDGSTGPTRHVCRQSR